MLRNAGRLGFGLLVFLLPFAAHADQPARLIAHAGGIPGEYIVALDRGLPAGEVDAVVAELSRRFGGEVLRQYRNVFPGFAVRLSDTQAAALSLHPSVELVEQNLPVVLSGVQSNPPNWALDRIDQHPAALDASYTYNSTGSGVNVYVVDSGIRFDHTEFGGRAVFAADFVNDGFNGWDCYGHGTNVAGVIGGATYGVAKQATLHSVRVMGCQPSAASDIARIISAFDWLITHHVKPAVVNASFNYWQPAPPNTQCANQQPHALMNGAADALIGAGVPLVNSAGNQACAVNSAPAKADPNVIVVGATWWNGVDRYLSNTAWDADVYAPGSNLLTAASSSPLAVSYFSNTSAAAAVVSGVVARYLQAHPTATPAQVEGYILATATWGVIQGVPGTSGALLIYADPLL